MIHFCGDGYSSVFPLTASKCCYPPYRLSNLDDLIHTLDLIVGFQLMQNEKAKFPGTSLYALGRSWFKEGVTEKAKGYLKEVVEQAKAAMVLTRMSRKKGKMVQKQVLSTSALRGKKKFVPKIRSLNDILRAIDQEGDN